MKLRIPTIVVVILMVLVAFSGMSRNASAETAPSAPSTPSDPAAEYRNATLPNDGSFAPIVQGAASGTMIASQFPSGVISGQTTYVYTFDTSAEGFAVVNPQTYSDLHWDSANKRIYIYSDRRDPGDEMFAKNAVTLGTTADFTVTARWQATVQGNWQNVFPIFLIPAASTQVNAANSIYFIYVSRDSNLGWTPYYYMQYRDSTNTVRINTVWEGQVGVEYHFLIHYDSSVQMLTMEIRSSSDATLALAHYRIGTNPNDGFTVGRIGAASDGMTSSYEPTTTGWVDDIVLTYATGNFRDATVDQGDLSTKIGWLADNFNDATNEIWTVVSGSIGFTSGQMELNAASWVKAGSSWYDQKLEFTFTIENVVGFTTFFRTKDDTNEYYLTIPLGSPATVTLTRLVANVPATLGSFSRTIVAGTPYTVKIVATGNAFEVWWDGVLTWSGTDAAPPSPIAGNIGFLSGNNAYILLDNVRVWNTASGMWTDIVRDAGTGTSKPLRTQISGTMDAFNQIHLQERSSADNAAWGPWTNLKADVKAGYDYAWPDQDRRRYYQVRSVLTSGVEGTPSLTSVTTATGTPSTTPTGNTGFETWYPYVGGLVNAVNGNLWYSTTDLSLRAKGFTLSVARSYNSLLGSTAGPFGNGWTFDYGQKLTVNGDSSVTLSDPDGSQHAFQPKATTGTYDAPRGVTSRLVKNADNSFTLWGKDGSLETFTSSGRLSSFADKNGNDLTLTYTSGRLTSVADASGKTLYLGYDASGQIVRAWDQEVGSVQNNPTAHSGSWTNGQNAFTSNNAYASTKTSSALHTYSGYGFVGASDVGIWKVEACVEAYTAGDDDLGVKISTNGGASWSGEQVVNLPSTDPGALTCLDFTSYKATWWWSDLSDANFRVQVRYVKVGGQGSYDYLDWIPVKVSTASRLVRYVYDGLGNLIQAVDPMGVRTEQYWYTSGKLTEMTDHTGGGKYVKFTYDASNRATEIWLGSYNGGVLWKYRAYQIAYSTTTTRTITNARGYSTTLTLNSFGNPTQSSGPSIGCSVCDGSGNSTSYAWDGEMNEARVTDGRGFAWTLGVDPRSNGMSRLDSGGNVSTSTWSEVNTPTQYITLMILQTTFRGYTSQFAYDSKGNLVKLTDAAGNYTDSAYDAAGFLNRSTDFRRHTTWYEFNGNGYLTKVTSPLSQVTQYGYDAWGRQTSVTSPLTYVTATEYDKVGRVTKVTDPLLHFTSNEYNARGDLIRTTDMNGNSTTYQVNVTNGRVQVQTDALGNSTQYAFDLRGNLLTTTDANNHITRYEYDSFDRPTKVTTPKGYLDGFFTSYAYDAAGNRIRRTDANGYSTTYVYDKMERLNQTRYAGPPVYPAPRTVYYQYDQDGDFVWTTGLGYAETAAYDELGRMVSVTFNYGSFGKTTTYTYDANGNLLTMKDPQGGTTTYEYDQVNRQTKITDPEGRITSFGYDKDSRRTSTLDANGITTSLVYDKAGRVLWINASRTGGTFESHGYTYDKDGDRLSEELLDGSTTRYEYDKLHRLVTMVEPDGWPTTYTYDAVGNLKSENSAPTYTYDEDDRLTLISWSEAIYLQYTYDNNGNRKTSYMPHRGQYSFSYDYENRLLTQYGHTYTYAGTGERVSTTEGTTTTLIGYDPATKGSLADVAAEYDAAGTRVARYTHGPGVDEPVGVLRSGSYYTYQRDAQGSITRISDASGNPMVTYTYDPWGQTSASGSFTNPFQYTGRETDSGGLYYGRARMYDPEARRFLSRDPAGAAGTSAYTYAGNNPVRYVDRTGARFSENDPYYNWYASSTTSTATRSPGHDYGGDSCAVGGATNPSVTVSTAQSGPVWTERCTESLFLFIVAAAFNFMGMALLPETVFRAVWNAHTTWAIGSSWAAATQSPFTLLGLVISVGWFIISSMDFWTKIAAGIAFGSNFIPLKMVVTMLVFGLQIALLLLGLHASNCI